MKGKEKINSSYVLEKWWDYGILGMDKSEYALMAGRWRRGLEQL